MPLSYGKIESSYPTLLGENVGYEPLPYNGPDQGLLTFFRVLLGIASIGIAFTGIGLVGTVAAEFLIAGANQAIDVIGGNANLKSTVINFVTPLISAGFVARTNRIFANRAIEAAEIIDKTTRGTRLANKIDVLRKAGLAVDKSNVNEYLEAAQIIKYSNPSELVKIDNGTEIFVKQIRSALPQISGSRARTVVNEIRLAVNKLDNISRFSDLDKVQRQILIGLGFDSKDVDSFINQLSRSGLNLEQRYSAYLGFIRDQNLLTNQRQILKPFLEAWQNGSILLGQAYQLPVARAYKAAVMERIPESVLPAVQKASKPVEVKNFFRKLWATAKNPSSAKFNDYIVQPLQAAFDPNDLGRALPEYITRQVKKWSMTVFKETKAIADKAKSLSDLFVKTGGNLVNSTWVLGYKVLIPAPIVNGPTLSMVSFYPAETNSKKPVAIRASQKQLLTLARDGGSYYLDKFAYSRGGRSLGLSGLFQGAFDFKKYERMAQVALSFIPITALRNLLSITSNVVENVHDMIAGTYSQTYWKKLRTSFQRNAINRLFRITANSLVGGYVRSVYGNVWGRIVGKELQRIGTNILGPMLNNYVSGQPNMRGITKGKVLTALASGVRSHTRKALKLHRGNGLATIQITGIQRKLKQVNRIPNALSPGRPYRGFRFKG